MANAKHIKKAWEILTGEEKSSLNLSLGHQKSTWEAGEIMGKSHYKYLEIRARAERFYKGFSDYFKLYNDLVPLDLEAARGIKDYFYDIIVNRKTIQEAIKVNADTRLLSPRLRDELIIELFNNIDESTSQHQKDFKDILIEFDRWNNFRILPLDLREPSAFKRRNKANELRALKRQVRLSELVIEYIINKYKSKVTKKPHKNYYVAIINNSYDSGGISLPILRKDKEAFDDISDMGLHIFKTNEEALDFIDLVYNYIHPKSGKKTCNQGQLFWPNYRVKSESSVNYEKLNKINPLRKFKENIYKVPQKIRKISMKDVSSPEDRVNDDLFY